MGLRQLVCHMSRQATILPRTNSFGTPPLVGPPPPRLPLPLAHFLMTLISTREDLDLSLGYVSWLVFPHQNVIPMRAGAW